MGKLAAASANHLLRIVDAHIMRGDRGKTRRRTACAHPKVEDGHSLTEVSIEQNLLTGAQRVHCRIASDNLWSGVDLKMCSLIAGRHIRKSLMFAEQAPLWKTAARGAMVSGKQTEYSGFSPDSFVAD